MLYIRAVAAEVMRYNFYRKMCKNVSDNIKDIYHRKKLEAAMIRGIIFSGIIFIGIFPKNVLII